MVRLTGTFHPTNGLPVGSTENATLSIYREQLGGTPLWQETQNLVMDPSGQYSAMLGVSQKDGVPLDLFSTTEPRWLGVQFNRSGEVEQPRVQLVSVPYALRASDAETLGGKPASAYLLDPSAPATSAPATGGTGSAPLPYLKTLKPFANGAMNYIPYFTDNSNDLGNSVLYQSGGNIGIGTASPTAPLTFADPLGNRLQLYTGNGTNRWGMGIQNWTFVQYMDGGNPGVGKFSWRISPASGDASAGTEVANLYTVGNLDLVSSTNGMLRAFGTGNNYFAGNVGIGAPAPSQMLEVNGMAKFDRGIMFGDGSTQTTAAVGGGGGGGGSITSVVAGTDLTGGGTSGAVTLNVDTTKVPTLNSTVNSFTGIVQAGGLRVNGTATITGTLALQNGLFLQGSILGPNGNILTDPTDGSNNFAAGFNALGNVTYNSGTGAGGNNAAFGDGALQSDTTGAVNAAVGANALQLNTTGSNNTAVGYEAMQQNLTGSGNTAIGGTALLNNNGSSNSVLGFAAAYNNTTGSNNTAVGSQALGAGTTATGSTAIGASTLFFSSGTGNVAVGYNAAGFMGIGSGNVAVGNNALTSVVAASNGTNNNNAAVGSYALQTLTNGTGNVAVGNSALSSLTSGTNNIALGPGIGSNMGSGSNNIYIGSFAGGSESSVIRIGDTHQTATFIAGIWSTNLVNDNTMPVVVDQTGRLGISNSSRRFKKDIQDMGGASAGIMRLRPVTFRYKEALTDGSEPMQYGLIAEEVADVYPELVARSADGQPYAVRYQYLDSLLLNEVQKQEGQIRSLEQQLASEHQQNAGLQDRLARLEAAMAKLNLSQGIQ